MLLIITNRQAWCHDVEFVVNEADAGGHLTHRTMYERAAGPRARDLDLRAMLCFLTAFTSDL